MNLSLNKNFNTKQKISNTSFLTLLFVLLIVYFVIFPSLDNIKDKKNEIIAEKIKIEKNKIYQLTSKNQENQLKNIETDLEKIEQIYINRNKELEFITTLEGLAKTNNVEQKIDILFARETKKEEISEIPISLSATGNFENILSYLRNLNNLPFLINVDLINLEKISNEATIGDNISESKISVGVSGVTYWR